MYYLKDTKMKMHKKNIGKYFIEKNDSCHPLCVYTCDSMNKFTCKGCGRYMGDGEFMRIAPTEFLGHTDKHNQERKRSLLCYKCIFSLWEYYKEQFGDEFKALYKVCSYIGVYYHDFLARKLQKEHFAWEDTKEELPDDVPWVMPYFVTVTTDEQYKDKSFTNSENLAFDLVIKYQNSAEGQADMLSEVDKIHRAQVMATFHGDPFEEEAAEDKPRLYEDLVTISTEGISEDLPKARAAIEIVRGYLRVDKINKALIQMQLSIDSMLDNEKSIKALTDQKKAELAAISTLAKENGFSEIANKMKTAGVGTLTGIMKQMNQNGFDRGAVNKFDIDTTEAMKKVADISAQSMFKQLAWTSADYADMVKEQAEMIRKMQDTMQKQAEELRLLKEEHIREELIERYQQELLEKNIEPEEVDRLVEEELKYIPIINYLESSQNVEYEDENEGESSGEVEE